jgi:hypothetical protein
MTALAQTSQNLWGKLFDYCHKSYQCLIYNPKLFLMRKLARIEVIRNWVSFLSKFRRQSYEMSQEAPSILGNIKVDAIVSGIRTDSYAPGIHLPQAVVQEILDYAKSAPCYADRNSAASFYYREKAQAETTLGRKIRLGSYFHAQGCAAVRKLENDPAILAIAAQYLEAPPVHIASELWWSFPVEGTPMEQLKAAQVFHYDLDDYRFIKFFFYLTDVDLSSGPHILIRGSHKNKKLSHQLLGVRCASKPDEDIVNCYGAENLVTICGPAGLGFAEDATCFHKGTLPTQKERLLLQIEFAINNYGDIRGAAS